MDTQPHRHIPEREEIDYYDVSGSMESIEHDTTGFGERGIRSTGQLGDLGKRAETSHR